MCECITRCHRNFFEKSSGLKLAQHTILYDQIRMRWFNEMQMNTSIFNGKFDMMLSSIELNFNIECGTSSFDFLLSLFTNVVKIVRIFIFFFHNSMMITTKKMTVQIHHFIKSKKKTYLVFFAYGIKNGILF